MLSIKVAKIGSRDYKRFKEWLLDEWGKVDQLPDLDTHRQLPLPLLAYEGDLLVGGLAYIRYPHPQEKKDALWVNAVYVHRNWRHRGIASLLIHKAEEGLQDSEVKELFVYTDKPDLYAKCGWLEVSCDKGHYVFVRNH